MSGEKLARGKFGDDVGRSCKGMSLGIEEGSRKQ